MKIERGNVRDYYYILAFLFLVSIAVIVSVSIPAKSETVIYDNITTSQYKSITLTDDLNIAYINDYVYDVYLNNSFLGTYKKGDKIFFPDGVNVSIVVPKSNINTDISSIWDIGHTNFYIALMYSITGLVIVLVIYFLIRKALRK